MEMIIQPQYVTDTNGKTISAILPIDKYNEILEIIEFYEEQEMLENIKSYKKTKLESSEYISFDEVLKNIENSGDE